MPHSPRRRKSELPPRPEYPRPQLVRTEWLNLNGIWEFAFDDGDLGIQDGWWKGERPLESRILVPFVHQSALSGIADPTCHNVVWYRRTFDIPRKWAERDLLLHFGAVDYSARVWVNGCLAAVHEGGNTPFTADISHLASPGQNVVVVRAEDDCSDLTQPRGKQYWKERSEGIFYTRSTGIWQTVWVEPVPAARIERVRITPDIDMPGVDLNLTVYRWRPGMKVRAEVTFGGQIVADDLFLLPEPRWQHRITLPEVKERLQRMWWPWRPHLHDLHLTLIDPAGAVSDTVESYFGFRKVSVENGRFCINNVPFYQRLVLDQGYWPESLLTPPSDDAIQADIQTALEMGFNGVRKHQKVEDPRYLYWADRLGLLVWGEMANAYYYSEQYAARITAEWAAVIDRDYSHPCIVAWVPGNESWGVPHLNTDERQRHHLLSLYHLTRSLDPTRPVSTNDGWEQPLTDLFTVHDYSPSREVLLQRYGGDPAAAAALMPADRRLFLPGFGYAGQPLIISEFGGIAFKQSEWEGWGYSGATDGPDFLRRFGEVISALHDCAGVQGYCYTQLFDVEQEINGLLTYDRTPKVPLEELRRINLGNQEK